ncbi:MAG TPA: hypothetical protein VL443_01685 [Cyclobacteriaceae bacterium]|nr:hypothetical protein [Cyclobacteriaceae bacterium]
MQKLFRIPLLFLFIGGCIGLMLRWNFISPQPWFDYPNWLHTHSHIMFLGWILNLLLLAYLYHYHLWRIKQYRILFTFIQTLLAGMMISFPLQGYGTIAIILSVLHTLSLGLFIYWLLKDLKAKPALTSIWYTRMSLILFIISSLGPFALAPIMANGLGHSKWYFFIVYYYLHFQYNGVFIFGVLSLFFHLLELRDVKFDVRKANRSGMLLLVSLFPGYFLSTLWAAPGMIFNLIGLFGAILQLLAIRYFIKCVRGISISLNPWSRLLIIISLLSFCIKSFLQLLSAHPDIAKLAYEVRPFVITYLHLVVIGVITFFLLAWYIETNLVKLKSSISIILLVVGFAGSELTMLLSGISQFDGFHLYQTQVLFLFSACLLFGIAMFTAISYSQLQNED